MMNATQKMKMRPDLAALAMRRQKWETRRPFKGVEPYRAGVLFEIDPQGPALSGFRPIIRLVDVRKEALQWSMDLAGALAEGFPTVDAFQKAWDGIYTAYPEFQWAANPLVWVIRFELVRVIGPEKPGSI